jgi:hypothetical protein
MFVLRRNSRPASPAGVAAQVWRADGYGDGGQAFSSRKAATRSRDYRFTDCYYLFNVYIFDKYFITTFPGEMRIAGGAFH